MKQFSFKTNINCSGCVAKVTPVLNEDAAVKQWAVDTTNPDKILTVSTDNLNEEDIKALVQKAGFKADKLV